jgi:hypothetical protein
MTKREWLAAKNLAIPGARGKFSREAVAAIAAEEARCKEKDIPLPWTEKEKPVAGRRGRKPKVTRGITEFEKAQGITEIEPIPKRAEIISIPVRRPETFAWVVDKGIVVAIQFCGKCQKSISRCTHDIPYAPDYLGGQLASFEKPVKK